MAFPRDSSSQYQQLRDTFSEIALDLQQFPESMRALAPFYRSAFPEDIPADAIESAVMILGFIQENAPHLLITKRSDTLRSFPGINSFPGGKREEGESVLKTALREAEEELGIKIDLDAVLGFLSPIGRVGPDERSYKLHPVVGAVDELPPLTPNPSEVSEVLTPDISDWFDLSLPPRHGIEHQLIGVTGFLYDMMRDSARENLRRKLQEHGDSPAGDATGSQ